jgi:hypothetical protein
VKTKGKRKPHPGQAEAAHSERDDDKRLRRDVIAG